MLGRLLRRRAAVNSPRRLQRGYTTIRSRPPSLAVLVPRALSTASTPHTTARHTQPSTTVSSHCPINATSNRPSSVPDLSHISEPIGALYPLFPPTRRALSPFLLTAEQLDFYATNGYISNLACLTVEQCDAILTDYTHFLHWNDNDSSTNNSSNHRHPGLDLFHEFHTNQTGDPQNVLCHGLGQWRVSPLFHDLVFHPALTVRVAQCLAACFTAIPARRYGR